MSLARKIHTLRNRTYWHFATIMLNCLNLLHAGLQKNRTIRAKPQLGLFSGANRLLRLGIGFSRALKKILLRLDLYTRTSIYSQACSRANRAGPLTRSRSRRRTKLLILGSRLRWALKIQLDLSPADKLRFILCSKPSAKNLGIGLRNDNTWKTNTQGIAVETVAKDKQWNG